ncbi:MAG: VCBS repeat-containing protein, partial [Cyclobacteriaceae bacterium]|nr:VCBS repeat-containing protein [Cyclobacteriaceae bacterium]
MVEVSPENIVPRLQLIEMLMQNGETDKALQILEEIGQQFPEFTPEAADYYKKTIDALHNEETKEALTSLLIFHNFLKLTTPYQAGIKDLKGPGGALIGFPVITFSETTTSFLQEGESLLDAIKFTDVTSTAGLELGTDFKPGNAHLSVGDFDDDGDQDIYFGSQKSNGDYAHYLLVNDLGMFKESGDEAGLDHSENERFSAFADYDNDGHLDLLVLKDKGLLLYRNEGEGKLDNVTGDAFENANEITGQNSLFLDADHEGDLDIFIGGSDDIMFRNNADGTFSEAKGQMGLGKNTGLTKDLGFGDFDDDGDIDLFVVREDGNNILYSNQRQGKFHNVTSETGIQPMSGSGAVAIGDYNNDGYLDMFITSIDGSACRLYKNKSDGTYEEDKASSGVFEVLKSAKGHDATFMDFDNDGHLDILVIGEALKAGEKGMFLFHNDGWGNFEDL